MFESIAMLRMAERILSVLIGGASIYLGYRLFFHLPFAREQEGQIELPGVKVVLSRVGPGIFFVAFGSLVLSYSLTTPVSIRSFDGNSHFIGATNKVNSNATPQDRSRALTSIEMLNCVERLAVTGSTDPELADSMSLAIRDAKTSMMMSVWDEADWGPSDQLGPTGISAGAPLQVRSMFSATYPGCPK